MQPQYTSQSHMYGPQNALPMELPFLVKIGQRPYKLDLVLRYPENCCSLLRLFLAFNKVETLGPEASYSC